MKNSTLLNYTTTFLLTLGIAFVAIGSGVFQGKSVDAQQVSGVPTVTATQSTKYANGIRFEWSAVSGATGYEYATQYRDGTGSWQGTPTYKSFSASCTANRACNMSGRPGREYRIFIKAKNGPAPATSQASAIVNIPQITGVAGAYVSNSKARITWASLPPVKSSFSTKYEYRLIYRVSVQKIKRYNLENW